jgi:hypothetical protein
MTTNQSQMDFTFVQKASDAPLEHQWNIVSQCVLNETNYPGLTVEQTLQFCDALQTELDLRWENGGKQVFQEMLNKTFGPNAHQVA